MSMPRIYQAQSFKPNSEFCLDEQASHYVQHVLRLSISKALILFNGQGGEYAAVIERIEKKKVWVSIGDFNPREVESPANIQRLRTIRA